MAKWLVPSGLALTRPNVFTGIVWTFAGMEPGVDAPGRRAASERALGARAPATVCAQHVSQRDPRSGYRQLFAQSFEILEERVAQPDLGRAYLDERARCELADWA